MPDPKRAEITKAAGDAVPDVAVLKLIAADDGHAFKEFGRRKYLIDVNRQRNGAVRHAVDGFCLSRVIDGGGRGYISESVGAGDNDGRNDDGRVLDRVDRIINGRIEPRGDVPIRREPGGLVLAQLIFGVLLG